MIRRYFLGPLVLGLFGVCMMVSASAQAQSKSGASVSIGASTDGASATVKKDTGGEASASAATSKPAVSDATGRVDPAGVVGVSPAMEWVAKGNAAFVAQDVEGARKAYQEAIKVKSNFPRPHLLLGQTYSIEQKVNEASESYKSAQRFAMRDTNGHAKSLFLQADLLERRQLFDEAAAMWKQYSEYVYARTPKNAFADTAKGRVEAITKRKDLLVKYAEVKKRIEAREKELSAGSTGTAK